MICNLLLATSQSNKYPTMGILRPLPGHISYSHCRKNGRLFQQGGHRGRPVGDPIGQKWRKYHAYLF